MVEIREISLHVWLNDPLAHVILGAVKTTTGVIASWYMGT